MKLGEIKHGMIFRKNDKKRPGWAWIESVFEGTIYMAVSPISPKAGRKFFLEATLTSSRCPHRFHREKKCSGYSLVSE
jgi:hypothetical protein